MIAARGRLAGALLTIVFVFAAGPSCRRASTSSEKPAARVTPGADIRRIDVHTHVAPDAVRRLIEMMDTWGIDHAVNLSGGVAGGGGLEIQLRAARESGGRLSVFCNLDWRLARLPGYGERMAASLEPARQLGAIGLKVPKALGLAYRGPDRKLLPVDDRGLDPVWQRAGALGLPVAIHIGDPKAFWQSVDDKNERIDELRAHPGWSYHGEPVPSWEELYAGFERLVARHAKTTFIGVHFGNDPEDPARVARLLDRQPNLYIDTAARIPEIGRRPAAEMRQFFEKYQDRILFGTDLGVGAEADELMLGSTGATPPGPADVRRFFEATWRYFETADRQFDHPTPIQGRWKIDGVGLPRPILEKIYYRNASRLLGITIRSGRTTLTHDGASK